MNPIFSTKSPLCDIKAVVDMDENAYYLYLLEHPDTEPSVLRTLWICNRKPTPKELDVKGMEEGIAPMLPEDFVSEEHPAEGMEIDPEKLSAVWYESGDSIAVFYDDELICSVPPYAGFHDFPGFSRYAKGQHKYAWALPDAMDNFIKRIDKTIDFWTYMNKDLWQKSQEEHLKVLDKFFDSRHDGFFGIDGKKFPPRALAQGHRNGTVYGISLGVSLFPMPKSEIVFDTDYSKYSHVEFGFANEEKYSSVLKMMYPFIGRIADIPWKRLNVLWHGYNFGFDGIEGFDGIVLINPRFVQGLEKPKYRNLLGNEINLLWLVPITHEELEFLNKNGIDALLERCKNPQKLHIFNNSPKFS